MKGTCSRKLNLFTCTDLTCSLYYGYDPERLSACPLTVHALLHIADSITIAGPVWTYWAFLMECYCGALLPAVKSRRFPYSNLSNHISDVALLSAVQFIYDLDLSFKRPRPGAKKTLTTRECKYQMHSLGVSLTDVALQTRKVFFSHQTRSLQSRQPLRPRSQ